MNGRIKGREPVTKMTIIGKIRVGEKREKNGKEYPVSLDYFKASGDYSDMFESMFDKPKKLEILFLSDDISDVCSQRFELWKGKKLYGYGDGEQFRLWNKEKEEYSLYLKSEVPNIMEAAARKSESEWTEILTLRFLLTEFKAALGVWQLDTHGAKSSIKEIISTFDFVKEKRGSVVGIPFDLIVEKVTSKKPDSKSIYPVIRIIPKGSQVSETTKNLITQ